MFADFPAIGLIITVACIIHILTLFSSGVAVLLCQTSKKEFYKKFLYEPLPIEVSAI